MIGNKCSARIESLPKGGSLIGIVSMASDCHLVEPVFIPIQSLDIGYDVFEDFSNYRAEEAQSNNYETTKHDKNQGRE
jgi:hypothetical protein